MEWTKELVYAHLKGIRDVFKYKRMANINFAKLPDLSAKNYCHLAYSKLTGEALQLYIEIANRLNCQQLSVPRLDALYLSEFARTKKFPTMQKFIVAVLDQSYELHSADSVTEQATTVDEMIKSSGAGIKKFISSNNSVFAVHEDQTNTLYNMMLEGKISFIVYAYMKKQHKFAIDYKKIKDEQLYKVNKAADFLNAFELEELLT